MRQLHIVATAHLVPVQNFYSKNGHCPPTPVSDPICCGVNYLALIAIINVNGACHVCKAEGQVGAVLDTLVESFMDFDEFRQPSAVNWHGWGIGDLRKAVWAYATRRDLFQREEAPLPGELLYGARNYELASLLEVGKKSPYDEIFAMEHVFGQSITGEHAIVKYMLGGKCTRQDVRVACRTIAELFKQGGAFYHGVDFTGVFDSGEDMIDLDGESTLAAVEKEIADTPPFESNGSTASKKASKSIAVKKKAVKKKAVKKKAVKK